jgi:hypothetical protein
VREGGVLTGKVLFSKECRMRPVVVSLVIVLLACVGGCQKSGDARISGQVTLDGTPLETGEVRFAPADGKGPAVGAAVKAGKYEVNVPPGPKSIQVTGYKIVGTRAVYQEVPNSPTTPIAKQVAEQKLTREVKTSETMDFALKTK